MAGLATAGETARLRTPSRTPNGTSDLVLDLEGYQVWRKGVAVPLTRKERQLLECLASRPGVVFPRTELLIRVNEQRGRTLDVYICRLRRKLDDPEGTYIQTVRKVGYRLVGYTLPSL